MVAIVSLTQFCINIADLEFNLAFAKAVTDKAQRTIYFGRLYSTINTIALIIQFAVMPILFQKVSLKKIHLGIPATYLLINIVGFGVFGSVAFAAAGAFVLFKSIDYSLFSAAKELLYHPLNNAQKYGAKYIVDMIMYRASKGIIAIVLIYIQKPLYLNIMMSIFLILWMISVVKLFKMQKQNQWE